MKPIGKCEVCEKIRPFIHIRKYNTRHAGIISSKSKSCGGCELHMIVMLGNELKKTKIQKIKYYARYYWNKISNGKRK